MKLLIFVLGAASGIMLYLLIIQKRCLDKTNLIIEEVNKGNFNQRIRISPAGKAFGLLSVGINQMIEKLQSVSAEKLHLEESRKKMISNISHDLRTPLTSLLGYIELVEEAGDLSEEEKKKYIGIIKAKGKTLSILLEEFFQLSKIDADDMVMHKERINLSDIAADTAAAFYDEITASSMRLELDIPTEEALVYGDRVCLMRVMENLLSNALKYGRDGGVLGIAIFNEKENVRVDIWDRGKGIPEEDISFIFDRLYTSDKSRNIKFKGSGLGLAIARKLVEKQGGSISVSSIPYENTCFSFKLKRVV